MKPFSDEFFDIFISQVSSKHKFWETVLFSSSGDKINREILLYQAPFGYCLKLWVQHPERHVVEFLTLSCNLTKERESGLKPHG
jgi:hypothetical protein